MIEAIGYIGAASEALKSRKEEVNRLNVFPVPDGDTGTNMSLTIETVVGELTALSPDATLADVCKAISHGSLMGARGNSGVITSQILRGICEGALTCDTFDSQAIATCLAKAVEVSFQAVRKPVEGTILTVIRDTAEAAKVAAGEGATRDEALKIIARAAFESVQRTPELLPVLKENNVVDAGGFGLAILIEGFVGAVTGEAGELPDSSMFAHPEPKVAIEHINDWEGSRFMYCTEFLFHAEGFDEEAARAFLANMGDCELLVGAEPDYKMHVHTNTPGTVLTYMTERGQVSEVYIHNMKLQSEDRDAKLAEAAEAERKNLGFVAVAAGSGIVAILESLGVDYVVSGGQTMNPSTADLLTAIEKVNADQVIILPNNKNIIMAAQAAVSESGKPAAVVPTKSVPESFTAMFSADPEGSLEDNVEAMTASLEEVRCGEVTRAIKDARDAYGNPIRNGDVIGITDDEITVVGRDVESVTLKMIDEMLELGEFDSLTLLAGEDLKDRALRHLVGKIEKAHPMLEVDSHRGEQPLYPVVFSLE